MARHLQLFPGMTGLETFHRRVVLLLQHELEQQRVKQQRALLHLREL
jgi:hypothetical protein